MFWCGANCFILVLYLLCRLQSATGSCYDGSDATLSISSEQLSFRIEDEPTMCENSSWLQHAQLMPSILTVPKGKANNSTKPKVQSQSQQAGRQSVASSSGNPGAVGAVGNEYDDVNKLMGALTLNKQQKNKQADTEFTCKGEDGREVKWFVAVKEKGSYEYVFATSRNKNFQLGDDITNNGPVHHTISQTGQPFYYFAYTSYNSSQNQGHQNGVLMFGTDKGFWLIHSWRRLYENFNNNFNAVNVAKTKGQSFICTTHKSADLGDIIRQLSISNPKPENGFHWNFPPLQGVDFNRAEFTLQGGGYNSVHYSRSQSPDGAIDIYSLIAQHAGIGKYKKYQLLVQSWREPRQDVTILQQLVRQISTHRYPHLSGMNQNTDHSKWCVPVRIGNGGPNYPDNFVCIGDLNFHLRGGGAMCLYDEKLWEQFSDIANAATLL